MTPERRRELHARMQRQALQRRTFGQPLQAGHIVQAHVGGDYRIVVAIGSAGECLEAKAVNHALSQHKERNEFDRG